MFTHRLESIHGYNVKCLVEAEGSRSQSVIYNAKLLSQMVQNRNFSNIQGHTPNASLFTCNISTVLQQMTRLQLIENVSRSICHS